MVEHIKRQLFERIKQIHIDCHVLCKNAFGSYYEASGNIGVFCQSEYEYEAFEKLKNEFCEPSDNPDQKYFKLIEPIIVPAENDIPRATYGRLYIRKFDPSPYGKYLGDIDFVVENEKYFDIKSRLLSGEEFKGAEIYDRAGWDTIQITAPNINSVAYLSTRDFAKKVWVRF